MMDWESHLDLDSSKPLMLMWLKPLILILHSVFGYCYHNFGKQDVLSFSVFICFILTASVIITEGAGIMHA